MSIVIFLLMLYVSKVFANRMGYTEIQHYIGIFAGYSVIGTVIFWILRVYLWTLYYGLTNLWLFVGIVLISVGSIRFTIELYEPTKREFVDMDEEKRQERAQKARLIREEQEDYIKKHSSDLYAKYQEQYPHSPFLVF